MIPFGGGTSVVGGVAPLRGRWDTAVSLDLGRLDAVLEVDERSRLARVQAGRRLPEAGSRAGARTACGSGTCRRATSGRPSAGARRPARPGRPRRAWAVRGARGGAALRDAARGAGDAAGPGERRGTRRCASSCSGPRAARRDHASSRCASCRCRRRNASRRGSCPGSTTGCEVLRGLAQARARAGHRAAVGRGGDGDVAWRAPVGLGARCSTAAACWSAAGRARRAGGAPAARALVRGGALPLGRRPGEAWRAPASPARTCATTCSTAACWSRRSRRRRPGATWRRCTRAVREALRDALAATPRWSAATSRTCIRAAPRCTSRCWPARTAPIRRPVARARSTRRPRDRRGGRNDHPPPRDRPRPPPVARRRARRARRRAAARRGKQRCDPAGIMNPGKLLPD